VPTARILITGASGSGTTTLGRALAGHLGWGFVDTDDAYWVPSVPPYAEQRGAAERLAHITAALASCPAAVVSGSVVGWGPPLEDSFDLIVYLWVPAELRVSRLARRETERHGTADPAFLEWARHYDAGDRPGRSAVVHERWLAERTCPVLRLHGDFSTAACLRMTLASVVA